MTIYQERQLIKNLTGCRHICDIGDGLWENNNFMLFVVTCGNYEVVFAGCVAIVQRRRFRSFSIRQLGADIIKQPMYNKTRVASLLLLVMLLNAASEQLSDVLLSACKGNAPEREFKPRKSCQMRYLTILGRQLLPLGTGSSH